MTQETHFAKTPDGVYLAYQAVGSGAIDMVMDLHAFAGNVDLIWDEPDWGPLLTGLTEFARLIIHDRRGSGASTRLEALRDMQAEPPRECLCRFGPWAPTRGEFAMGETAL
jgi:pimeloyl-ACP methyl ester carboxylesterase